VKREGFWGSGRSVAKSAGFFVMASENPTSEAKKNSSEVGRVSAPAEKYREVRDRFEEKVKS
jgi:hypothetical protein